MNILIVAATKNELEPLLQNAIPIQSDDALIQKYTLHDSAFSVLITGIGILNTVFALSIQNLSDYDLIINAGICGSYGQYQIGEVLIIQQDEIAWFGKELENSFIQAEHLFKNQNISNIQKMREIPSEYLNHINLNAVKGLTVNCVNTQPLSIQKINNQYHADVETMEGAAFYFVCNKKNYNGIQIRSVSNFVAPEDEAFWDIQLAISNLNLEIEKIITNF